MFVISNSIRSNTPADEGEETTHAMYADTLGETENLSQPSTYYCDMRLAQVRNKAATSEIIPDCLYEESS
jgi:hypothetical protein